MATQKQSSKAKKSAAKKAAAKPKPVEAAAPEEAAPVQEAAPPEVKSEEVVESVSFLAKSPNYVLVIQPEDLDAKGSGGVLIKAPPRIAVEFKKHRAVIGKQSNGKAACNATVLAIDYDVLLGRLRDHRLLGATFWEEGNAPDEPQPSVEQRRQEIASAIAARDREALESIQADEARTHDRPAVLESVKVGLASLDEGGSSGDTG